MLRRWKYQIYTALAFGVIAMVAVGSTDSTKKADESWINTMFFNFFNAKLVHKDANCTGA